MAESAPRKKSSQDMLEEALKARAAFLKENPDLQPFQDEIDRIMEKTVGFENRMSVLAFMIERKLYQLRDSFAELQSSVMKTSGILREAKGESADELSNRPGNSSDCFN